MQRASGQFRRGRSGDTEEETPMLGLILVILLVILLIGALPSWSYSRSWGYYPGGGLGVLLVIVIILWLLGVLPG
jgi:hypothetical protein